MTRDELEALMKRKRPGWRVVDVVEVDDESGPSFEVEVELGGERETWIVAADGQVIGHR